MEARPRIFISYARSDGEAFARELRQRLEGEGFSLSQDLSEMEGGRVTPAGAEYDPAAQSKPVFRENVA